MILPFLFCCVAGVFAQDSPRLQISPEDLRIEQSIEGGYYLYIRRTNGIESVLLTESTEAVDHGVSTYSFRNPDYHPENGDEPRLLDGEFLDTSSGIYSLIDSTPIGDPTLGSAFRIFIPYVVVYGYEWSRHGELQVLDGTYMSVRSFGAPYADYSGGYRDNPFVLRVSQRRIATSTEGELMESAVEKYAEIAEETGGETAPAEDEDLMEQMNRLVSSASGRSLDLVLALDTTESMEDNVPALREELVPMLENYIADHDSLRVGLVYYRDYMEEYLTRRIEFQDDLSVVQRAIDTVRVAGGRDIPEAVFEALHASVVGFDWKADDRMVVLVGDAPPHPLPRGSITEEMVTNAAAASDVQIHTIILPQ